MQKLICIKNKEIQLIQQKHANNKYKWKRHK